MCNINLIYRKDKTASYKIPELMNIISFYSFVDNNDGEGCVYFLNDDLLIKKSVNKLRYSKPTWFLVSHQRLATSGYNAKNIHPIETKDLLILHNGVIYDFGDEEKSDTYYLAEMLQKHYKKYKDVSKAVRRITKEIYGSYSVVVIEKKTKKVFYFKNDRTNMFILNSKNYIIMSTERANVSFAKYWLKCVGKIKRVESNYVYDVLNGFKKIRVFEPKTYSCGYSKGWYGCYGDYGYDGYDYYDTNKSHDAGVQTLLGVNYGAKKLSQKALR